MNKPTLAALAAFAVLLIAFVATREKEVSVGVQKLEVPSLPASGIEAITITGANAAKLERGPNGWTVADPAKADMKFPADDAQVQTLLTAISEFKAPDFVTDKTEKHAELEVTSEKGTTVVATAPGKTLSLVFGKGSKNGGTYVRKADATAVFSTPSQMSWQVKRNVTAWRKKTITTAPADQVAQLSVTRADGASFTLSSQEGSWALTSPTLTGFRFDKDAAQRFAAQLSTLSAQDFLSAPADYGKATTIVMTLKDGKTLTLKALKRDDSTWALQVSGDAQEYVLPSWIADQLDKKVEDLRDLRLVDFDVAKATRLTITAGGKKTVAAKEGETWKLLEPKTAPAGVEFDGNQVVAQLNRLKGARAAKVAEVPVAKAGLSSPGTLIEVLVDGKPVRLAFGGDVSAGEVYAKGSIDELVYVIAGSEKQSWATGAQLFNKPPPPPDFGQMQGLEQLPPEIRQKLMEQLRQQRN